MKDFDESKDAQSMADESEVHQKLTAARLPAPRPELREIILRNARLDKDNSEEGAVDTKLPAELQELEEQLSALRMLAISPAIRGEVLRFANGIEERIECSKAPALRVLCWSSIAGMAASMAFLAAVLLMEPASIEGPGERVTRLVPDGAQQIDASQEISELVLRYAQFSQASRRSKAAFPIIDKNNESYDLLQ